MTRVWGEPFRQPDQDKVDSEIWPAVERINRSGWVWTTESCAGHGDKNPLLGLVTNDPGRLFTLLADVLIAHPGPLTRFDPNSPHVLVGFYSPSRDLRGQYHFRLVVMNQEGLSVLNTLSERV